MEDLCRLLRLQSSRDTFFIDHSSLECNVNISCIKTDKMLLNLLLIIIINIDIVLGLAWCVYGLEIKISIPRQDSALCFVMFFDRVDTWLVVHRAPVHSRQFHGRWELMCGMKFKIFVQGIRQELNTDICLTLLEIYIKYFYKFYFVVTIVFMKCAYDKYRRNTLFKMFLYIFSIFSFIRNASGKSVISRKNIAHSTELCCSYNKVIAIHICLP